MTVGISSASHDAKQTASAPLRVLLVPDSIHWITGTIARSIVAHNGDTEGTIISGPVLDVVAREQPALFESFDLVHFVCPYASRRWLPELHERLPCVTSHHHVSDAWELQRHNLDGDAIIVGSSQWADDARERGAPPGKVVRVPYGVDASRYAPATAATRRTARASIGILDNATVVGFFAKLSSNERDRKGTDVFVAAATLLAQRLPRLVVLIIGPGWDTLVAELRNAGVTSVWLPFVRDSDRMLVMYRALDFYWVTARVEGGPVTLLEAMSTGLCCITTRVGLARDIVQSDVNGVLVPFDDPESFARQTLALAEDEPARSAMGRAARQTILETMDLPITAPGVRKAYDVAIAQFAARTGRAVTPSSATVSATLRRRCDMLEELTWAEALILQGQRTLAYRTILSVWLAHPLSSLPPRFLFRNLLPKHLVRALVRARPGNVAVP